MDTDKLNEFIKNHCTWQNGILSNRSTKRRISAILPVHILGHPVNMKPLLQIARKYNLKVIEDSTESLGAKYDGDMSGSLGDIACFSFNGNKLITTGGGGMIVTNNHEWAELAKHLTTQAKSHQTEYIHDQIGYNYRLTNIQAAMGVAQMENIQRHIQSKQNIQSILSVLTHCSFSGATISESSSHDAPCGDWPLPLSLRLPLPLLLLSL